MASKKNASAKNFSENKKAEPKAEEIKTSKAVARLDFRFGSKTYKRGETVEEGQAVLRSLKARGFVE